MTAGTSGRWTCAKCGANNFDTVTACWKCNTTKHAGSSSPQYAPSMGERPMQYAPAAPVMSPSIALQGDPGTAKRAALLLAFTLPFIGLPVGWVFMMMEDYRRQAIGRFCVLWSCVALLVHFFVGIFMLQVTAPVALRFLAPMLKQMQTQGKQGQGMEFPRDFEMNTPGN